METYGDFLEEMVFLRIKQQILGQGPFKCPAAWYPADWIEAVKERFAPHWFLKRWPVKYTKKYFNARIMYPKVRYPEEEYTVTADVKTEEDEDGIL